MNLKSSAIIEAGSAYLFKSFACSNRNQRELALSYADSSYKYLLIQQDVENIHEKIYSYKLLGQVYTKYKVFDKALRASLTADTLLHDESRSDLTFEFAKMENDFQLKNSKSEIDALKSLSESQAIQVQSQRQIIGLVVGIVVIFIIAFLLTFYLFRKSKLAEKEIQAKNLLVANQNQELKKQNELQLLTIGIVGHDLRSPLASSMTVKEVIISMLEAGNLDKSIHLTKLHFEGLERIYTLANNLVKWVLSAQSGISLNFSEIKVAPLVNKVSSIFEGELKEKNITLQNNVGENVTIFADASSVETILRNIIQNAIKFTPDGKKITIKSLISDTTPDFVAISIIDEGKGMPSDILEKLNSGNRMFTLGTRGEKGNGLGLIMIQTLLSLNNGKIKISSEIGVGTSFSVLLPAKNLN
jgi:signal transduction histidine kinase